MAPKPSTAPANASAFELKGRMLTLSVLRVFTTDLQRLAAELDAKVAQAPGFFRGLPVALDLEAISGEEFPDLEVMVALLKERQLQPVGVRSGSALLNAAAAAAGLPLLSGLGQDAPRRAAERNKEAPAAGLIVRQPVRSGQQIYARGGDLVVLASVSPGAEVLADGHIHIYGTLRGRALAGVQGDRTARIFCRSLQAELISIAGNYQISEQFREAARGQDVQVFLDGDSLCIEPLG